MEQFLECSLLCLIITIFPQIENQERGKNISDDGLASLAKAAIKQIRDNKDTTEMEGRGIENIGLFGIDFSGKHVVAEFERKRK